MPKSINGVRLGISAFSAALLAGCSIFGQQWVPREDPVDFYGYRAVDRTLALTVQVGCEEFRFTDSKASEHADAVLVDVRAKYREAKDVSCAAVLKVQTVHVRLQSPLGSKVVRTRAGRVIAKCAVFQPAGTSFRSC